ncbi:hypothetical protein FBQ81_05535 [Chloroflexi bacterium CFX6]|nr:hypothetical protein [Chloroflexi bacterium CFX6]
MDDRTIELLEKVMEKPIAFHRIFKTITGNTNAALFLSRAFYWSKNKKAKERSGWFYKAAEEWEEEIGLTRREQETARRKCKKIGVLEEKLWKVYELRNGKKYGHATLHFRVNKKRVYELIEKIPSFDKPSKLVDSTNHRNYVDSTNEEIYLNNLNTNKPTTKKMGEAFKSWKDAPQAHHAYFQTCMAELGLPEPTTQKEIEAWMETFTEWMSKDYTPKQIPAAARFAHKRQTVVSRPASITYALSHLRRKPAQEKPPAQGESTLAKLAQKQRRT